MNQLGSGYSGGSLMIHRVWPKLCLESKEFSNNAAQFSKKYSKNSQSYGIEVREFYLKESKLICAVIVELFW